MKNNVTTNGEARYMDDIRLWLWSIRLGWRWTGKSLEYSTNWMEEDKLKGLTPLQKTTEIISGMMNSICEFLTLTMETGEDFGDGRLPTLDLNIWIGQDNKILFTFFEKPMASTQTIQKMSAMPENGRMATLNQELVRRMLNTSEDLEMHERIVVTDKYCQKLTDSGYDIDQIKRVVIGGLTGYERRRALSLLDPANRKFRPLHESRKYNAKARRIAKIMEKGNWFKRKPDDDTLPEGSPSKKRRVFQQDGNTTNVHTEVVQAQGGEVMGEGRGVEGLESRGLDGLESQENINNVHVESARLDDQESQTETDQISSQ